MYSVGRNQTRVRVILYNFYKVQTKNCKFEGQKKCSDNIDQRQKVNVYFVRCKQDKNSVGIFQGENCLYIHTGHFLLHCISFNIMSYSGYEPPCPAPTRVKCSWCHFYAYGRCDHCRQRFNPPCFQQHAQTCPGARNLAQARLRLVPECCFCNNDAVGTCEWCNEQVCNGCFVRSHKTKYKYVRR
jgi:hypothetical protein